MGRLTAEPEAVLRRMTDAIRHRGPDDEGQWLDPAAGVALGHRRLSIIDLSPEGHQPMVSPSGRYVLVYNGEIYNFEDLRRELLATGQAGFRGRSDTEVMLAAIDRWGLVQALGRMAGMFAFALWDRETRTLALVRDRMGEKPLYYGRHGGTVLFGSELKALRRHPRFDGAIDRGALAAFLRYAFIPAPHTIYHDLWKVPAGSVVTIRADGTTTAEPYWSALATAQAGAADPFTGSDAETVDWLEGILRRTIRQEMMSDVPLGAFLSGGLDSSLVVALMQAESAARVRTFTIGFPEAAYDEAPHARAVAQHLGTDHTELYVSSADALDVIPRLPMLYDEPFADPSQIPTFLVAELAARHVTVSLSGDGGDELFAGYDRYPRAETLWRWVRRMPRRARVSVAGSLALIPEPGWDAMLAPIGRLRGAGPGGDTVHKVAGLMRAETAVALYGEIFSQWRTPARVLLGGAEPALAAPEADALERIGGLVPQLMLLDQLRYLPDDILVKVDRASMAVSLEARAPFLDHRVVEAAWQLPHRFKVREGRSKWILRRLLDRFVPRALVERPKMGFGVPIESWLRGPLRAWAEALLAPARLRREGFFDAAEVDRVWQAHLAGRRDRRFLLWDVLMFQAWHEATVTAVEPVPVTV